MKAIEQIIAYLNGRGLLSVEQLTYLERHGLWDRYGEHRQQAEDDASAPLHREVLDPEDWEVELEARLARERRGRGGRKGKEVVHKGPVLEPEEVAAALAARSAVWEAELEGLLEVARRLGPCAGWREAAVVIRNAGPEELHAAVARGLRARAPALRRLWDAVSLEDYCDVLDRRGLHGPVAVAYRAILTTPEYAQLGKYAWLLKTEEVSNVFNLKQAQRQLLLACERLFSANPGAVVVALQRDFHPLAYWTFVLLYTARRDPAGHPPEHAPSRARPDEAGWLRVWAHTAVMDPVRLLPLLVRCKGPQGPATPAAEAVLGLAVWPRAWDPKGPDWPPEGAPDAPQEPTP